MEYTRTLTPSLSHSMGEGARRAGEGRLVVYPGHSVVLPDSTSGLRASQPEMPVGKPALLNWGAGFIPQEGQP
jgi:hypothetical protein